MRRDAELVYVLELYDKETELMVGESDILLGRSEIGQLIGIDLSDDQGYGYDLDEWQVGKLIPFLLNPVGAANSHLCQLGSRFKT